MDIKNVLNSIIDLAGVKKERLDRKTTLDASGERDTNLGYGQEEASQHKMTEEEVQEVIAHLNQIDGVKTNNLQVRSEKIDERYIIYIEDPDGKTIRRIPESEMWFIYQKQKTSGGKKGQILNKAM